MTRSEDSIDFVYDVVCPHAYLASQAVQAAAARLSMTVHFRPVLLGGVLRSIGAALDPNAAMPPPRAALLGKDLRHRAARARPPLSVSVEHPRRTVEAMRLCVVACGQARTDISHALFRAHWEHGRDVSDLRVLGEVASAHGMDIAMIHAPAAKVALRESTQWAVDRGVFGVPTFVVGSRLWWGADRIELMVRALGGTAVIDSGGADGGSGQRQAKGRRVEFFHDFASPFAYLASEAVDGVAARYGVTVRWRPILVGALFRTIGTADVPLLAMPAAKQAYLRQDLSDWAAARQVQFRFPRRFPIRSVLPLRVAVSEPRTAHAIYRAAWSDDRQIDDPGELAVILAQAGFDADALLRAAATASVKNDLRSNTTAAQNLGACGVPTLVVYDELRPQPLVLWGQDRLDLLDAALAGWWPASE